MTERFEHKGVWWLPERPERRIYGTLKFDPVKGASLDLFGSLRDAEEEFPLEPTIVLGEFSNGEPVTLYRCYEKHLNISQYGLAESEGFPQTTLGANYIFQGEHFPKEEDLRFKKLVLGFSHLRNWANLGRIKPETEEGKISLTYTRPADVEMVVDEIGSVTLQYSAGYTSSFSGAEIKKSVRIGVEATQSQSQSFEEWWKIIYLLQAFFTLATRHAVHPTSVEETIKIEVGLPDGTTGTTYQRIKIFFRISDFPDDSSTEGPRDMLFILKDLGGNFESCLQNWFKKAERLEPVYELYFGTLHQPNMYGTHQFASLIQALESYHRRTSNRSALPKAEWKQRIEEITKAAPDHLRTWLRDKLNFSNELSLRQRLEEIMATYTSIFGPVPNQDAFIKKVVDTRNYLTHYDASSKKKAAQNIELIYLSRSVKILVEMCLLKELGLSDAKVRHVLTRDQRMTRWFEHPPLQQSPTDS